MSRIASRMALVAAVIAALSVSVAFAQGGRRSGVPPRDARGSGATRAEEGAKAFDEALEKLGLTAKERTAAKEAMEKKRAAHQELRHELGKLQEAVADPKATDQSLQRAISSYRTAMERAEQKMAVVDRELAGKLSVKSQAKCLALGLLDNGLGRGGGMGMRGGGGDRGGGGRGGGGRGGGGRGGGRGDVPPRPSRG